MDSRLESIERWNKLTTSEQMALCAYWFELERGEPSKSLQEIVSQFQDRACVYDVPEIMTKEET
jgi:hypothetical protein